MIPGMGDLTNSGSMPITGGAATNGDLKSSQGGFGSNRFGAVTNNNQTGLNTNYLMLGAVVLGLAFLLKSTGKKRK